MSTVQLSRPTEHAEWRLSFGHLLRSEWIKLTSLRSTKWCALLIVVFLVGLSALISSVVPSSGKITVDAQRSLEVTYITSGLLLAQLIVAVIGVLVISGEYGTGMIRSSFAAAPRRVSVIVAKFTVSVGSTFILSIVSLAIAAGISTLLLPAKGIETRLSDPLVWEPVLGAAIFLALMAAFAFAIGALVRNSAAGIAITLGVLLVVPIIFAILGALVKATWITNLALFLPAASGGRLYTYIGTTATKTAADVITLTPVVGGLVLLGWVVLLGGIATFLIKKRDA